MQPIGAVLAALAVIALTPGTTHFGLQGPGEADLGVFAILGGVGLLIYDARRGGGGSGGDGGGDGGGGGTGVGATYYTDAEQLPPYERLCDTPALHAAPNAAGGGGSAPPGKQRLW